MIKLIRRLDRIVGYISLGGAIWGAMLILTMIVMISINIFVRKTIGWAFLFVEEYSGYALVLIVYFGLGYALRSEKHIHMELLIRKLPEKLKNYVHIITTFICAGLLIYLIYKSIQFFLFSLRFKIRSEWYSESIMWPFHLLIPIGLMVFFFEMVVYLYRLLAKFIRGEKIFNLHMEEQL